MVAVLAIAGLVLFVIRPDGGRNNPTAVASSAATQSQPATDDSGILQPTLAVTATSVSSAGLEATVKSDDRAEFDLAELRRLMLELINADRGSVGLHSLETDAVAETAAQDHADDMATLGYLSHWNVDGFGPDWRYFRSGGRDAVQENIYGYSLRTEANSSVSSIDWARVVGSIHEALSSDEHYAQNMLAPGHTHVGLGLAVNQVNGQVRVTQEFINRLVSIDPVPTRVLSGERIVIKGRLLDGSTRPVVNIAVEPTPQPLSLTELSILGYFVSSASMVETVLVTVNEKGEFVAEVSLSGPPGLYHIRTTVDRPAQGSLLASDLIVELAP